MMLFLIKNIQVLPGENDGVNLFSFLRNTESDEEVISILGSIEGP
jgi:hypothetical protein